MAGELSGWDSRASDPVPSRGCGRYSGEMYGAEHGLEQPGGTRRSAQGQTGQLARPAALPQWLQVRIKNSWLFYCFETGLVIATCHTCHCVTLIQATPGCLLSPTRLQNPAHDAVTWGTMMLDTSNYPCVSLLQGPDVLDQWYPWTGVFWWARQGCDRSWSTAGATPGTELAIGRLTRASSVTSRKRFLFPLQEHRTEIDARAGTFQAFEQFGQQLLARGHYASPEIQQKLEALDRERADLEKAWVQRRMMLDQCLELQVRGKSPSKTITLMKIASLFFFMFVALLGHGGNNI